MSSTTRRLHVQRLLAGFLCGLIGLLAFARWGFWAEMVGCVGGFLLGTALPRVSWRWSPRRAFVRTRTLRPLKSEFVFSATNFLIGFSAMLIIILLSASGPWRHTKVDAFPILFALYMTFLLCELILWFYLLFATSPSSVGSAQGRLHGIMTPDRCDVMHVARWHRFQRFGLMRYALDQYNRSIWSAIGVHIYALAWTLGMFYRTLYMWHSLPMMTTIAYFKAARLVRRWTESFAVSAVAAVATTIVSGYVLRPHFATLTVGLCALSVGVSVGLVSYLAPLLVSEILRGDENEERSIIAKCRAIIAADWMLARVSLSRHTPRALTRAWERWFPNMDHVLNLL